MANDPDSAQNEVAPKDLSPQARRALAEAQARRVLASTPATPPPEVNGRPGPEPVRYGDWENRGIASDF